MGRFNNQAGFKHSCLALTLGLGHQPLSIMKGHLVWCPLRYVFIKGTYGAPVIYSYGK